MAKPPYLLTDTEEAFKISLLFRDSRKITGSDDVDGLILFCLFTFIIILFMPFGIMAKLSLTILWILCIGIYLYIYFFLEKKRTVEISASFILIYFEVTKFKILRNKRFFAKKYLLQNVEYLRLTYGFSVDNTSICFDYNISVQCLIQEVSISLSDARELISLIVSRFPHLTYYTDGQGAEDNITASELAFLGNHNFKKIVDGYELVKSSKKWKEEDFLLIAILENQKAGNISLSIVQHKRRSSYLGFGQEVLVIPGACKKNFPYYTLEFEIYRIVSAEPENSRLTVEDLLIKYSNRRRGGYWSTLWSDQDFYIKMMYRSLLIPSKSKIRGYKSFVMNIVELEKVDWRLSNSLTASRLRRLMINFEWKYKSSAISQSDLYKAVKKDVYQAVGDFYRQ